jgi:beta-glucosidase
MNVGDTIHAQVMGPVARVCIPRPPFPTRRYLGATKRLVEAGIVGLLTLGSAQGQIYLDPSQPIEARIADLLPRMTPQQKISQLYTSAPAIPELQIPQENGWNQALHGVVWNHPTTMFPVSIAAAATWDIPLVNQMASAIGDEARAVNNCWKSGCVTDNNPHSGGQINNGLLYRAPVINMCRDPRWGRINEIWGEDTLLTSQMAIAYVTGLQGNDPKYLKIAATLKHAAVYNREVGRTSGNAVVPERWLQEYYTAQFKAAVVTGHAQSIMSSYNAINGVPATINTHLLQDIIRNEFGFDGIQVPDSGAIANLVTQFHAFSTTEQAVAASLKAGMDHDDTFAREPNMIAAFNDGLITEQDVDRAYTRVLRVRFRLGEFDPPSMVPYTQIPSSVINSNGALATKVAQEAVVLLKNDGILPLDRASIHKIAVIGPSGNIFTAGGYSGTASSTVNPLQGIQSHVAAGTQVTFTAGVTSFTSTTCNTANIQAAATTANQADVAIVFGGTNLSVEQEGTDRTAIELNVCQDQLIQAVYAANPKTVVVFMSAGPVANQFSAANIPGILQGWWNGQNGGNAIADVLFGDVNPAGRLPYTWYASTSQLPSSTDYDISHGYTYMYNQFPPLYPFGHGLSYTQFKYSNLLMLSKIITKAATLQVEFDVQNTGARAGDEVAQVYTRYPFNKLPRPAKQLVAFTRITLAPGETKHVTLSVPAPNLSYYDESTSAFVVDSGFYGLQVGSSSADIRLLGTYLVQ